jgi:sigma-54 specific flagellar transcriptional regulator A
VAPGNASVIVTGPSGSGKEMVARSIHAASDRSAEPYVAVNCGAIPRDLLESELFGHEKGAFTGAIHQRLGRLEEAHRGTLFLDEIGDMPTDMQVKLLRVLEERSIQRVGGRGDIAVDNRIISATHRDIDEAIEQQRFREDLFYRLAVFPIHLPSLAERRQDIPLLVRRFLRRGQDPKFTASAMDRMMRHDWPGNVRELRNVTERAAILYAGRPIGAEEVELLLNARRRADPTVDSGAGASVIPISKAAAVAPLRPEPLIGGQPIDLRSIISELEERYIVDALDRANGVVAEAARMLSLQRTTLIEKMRKFGLSKAA